MQPQPAQKKETAMPLIGGILILIGGIIELLLGAGMVVGGSALFGLTLGGSGGLVVCGVIVVIVGIVAVLGGIFAIQRRNFTLAIIGGILSMIGVLGLIGLILVAVSKDEFRD